MSINSNVIAFSKSETEENVWFGYIQNQVPVEIRSQYEKYWSVNEVANKANNFCYALKAIQDRAWKTYLYYYFAEIKGTKFSGIILGIVFCLKF